MWGWELRDPCRCLSNVSVLLFRFNNSKHHHTWSCVPVSYCYVRLGLLRGTPLSLGVGLIIVLAPELGFLNAHISVSVQKCVELVIRLRSPELRNKRFYNFLVKILVLWLTFKEYEYFKISSKHVYLAIYMYGPSDFLWLCSSREHQGSNNISFK